MGTEIAKWKAAVSYCSDKAKGFPSNNENVQQKNDFAQIRNLRKFQRHGGTPVIIHFLFGFFHEIHHPTLGVPHVMLCSEPSIGAMGLKVGLQ